ncbi:hypothetical protein [Pseudoxanthomonas sp. 3HH-4]|uniref:hypothetical protein n=1 Tax=Pseudoxanthomonas sp. 3HH-4 TaxID=1690214 RepID=UPI001153E7CF|nr:hypothetical protein [Pseudoxanthomonas sp. 3HH-4]
MSTPSLNFFSLVVTAGRRRQAWMAATTRRRSAHPIRLIDMRLKKNIGKTRFFFSKVLQPKG